MVLKEKEDLCKWFGELHSRKRIDYMCGLLHLCLPLELRFIGTVLEDIAKENFNCLRDAENKANNPSELTQDDSQDFSEPHFRAKTLVNLALMHSANSSCADILFKVLERQFANLTTSSQDRKEMEEMLTILTIACHHPAFNIKQRLRLGEILKNTEDHCHHHWANPVYPNFLKTSQSCLSTPCSNRPSKGITSMVVNGINDEHQNKKLGPDYEIIITWSNGETTQNFMKHKDLQNLHNQIFNKFSDEKKLQSSFPSYSGQRHHRPESKEDRISAMNSYLSELCKAHHILSCDILTRAFQSGKTVQPTMQVFPTASHQTVIYPAYMHENRYYGHYPESPRVSYFPYPNVNMIALPATAFSSSTTSPANSRSSSPSVTLTNNKNAKSSSGTISFDKGGNTNQLKTKVGLHQQHAPPSTDQEAGPQVEICQLLRLLGLEKYSDNLINFSLQEVCSMTSEELSKLGLPLDAHIKLQSRLDQHKHNLPDVNGIIQLTGPVSKQERAMHSFPTWQSQGHLSSDSHQQPLSPYPPPPHQYHVITQINANALHSHPPLIGGENSPATSELGTPSLSPGLRSLTDSPPSSLASPTSVYLEEKSMKNHQVDSSGSEDDKIIGQVFEGSETTAYRKRGPSRPQQSVSLPLLNHNATTSPGNGETKGKVMGVPSSISAPVMNADSGRDGGTPPLVPIGVPMVNGFIPESPFITPNANFGMSHPALHQQLPQQQQHRYKSAQPTHTGPRMFKNVVNMPCLDMTSQPPPPPAPSISKTNGNMTPIMHPAILHHPYHILPPNLQTNAGILHHQPQPTNGGSLPQAMATDNGGGITTLPFMPAFLPPHSTRGVLTTMANSSGVISTMATHLPGQHPITASHSPSPVASSVLQEQGQMNYVNPNIGGGQEESSHPTKTSPPSHISNSTMSNNVASKAPPGSGTPSPPLISKQNASPCVTCDPSGHQQTMYVPPIYMIPNISGNGGVGMPPYSSNPHQQNSLQHFPNGITPEVYHLPGTRFPIPLGSGHLPPFYYGSQAFNPHIHHSVNNGNLPSHHTAGNNGGGGGGGGTNSMNNKSTCYNCGQPGHKGNECKEMAMDSMTNSFRLNMKPKSDSE